MTRVPGEADASIMCEAEMWGMKEAAIFIRNE
jgi:hypothetical protein